MFISCNGSTAACGRVDRNDCKLKTRRRLEAIRVMGSGSWEFLYAHKEGRLTASRHTDASRLDQKTMSVICTAFSD